MDVHGRLSRLASEFTKLLAELLLKVVVKITLTTEEDNPTLRDCSVSQHGIFILITCEWNSYPYQ